MANNVSNSYDAAIQTYNNYLPQLQAKYNNAFTQLQNELSSSQAKQGQLFGVQKTGLTNDIAKKGLTASAGDSFYDSEQGKLSANQNVQSQDLLTKYAGLRNDILNSQNQDTLSVNAAIANLVKDKANYEQSQKNWEEEMKFNKKKEKQAQKNWEKEHKQKKNESDRDYQLRIKESSKKKNENQTTQDYQDMLMNDISAVASGSNNYAPYSREMLSTKYKGILPNADSIIWSMLPNNWEAKAKEARLSKE